MKKRNAIALTTLGVIIIILLSLLTPLMRNARAIAWDVWVHGIARVFGFGPLDIPPSVTEQLETLRAQNVILKAELQHFNSIRDTLNLPSATTMRLIPAAVVSRPLDTFNSQYILNKGVGDGVTMGAPVVVRGSILVGTIVELNAYSSVVQSLFNPALPIAVEAISDDVEVIPARGLLKSRYFTTLFITTVPRDIPLSEGQDIVTSQKNTNIPYGLVIGTIEKVTSKEHEAYQEARLNVPYNIDTIEAVHILVPL